MALSTRYRLIIVLLLLVMCTMTSVAQKQSNDSLQARLKSEKEDTAKVNTLNALSSKLDAELQYDTAIKTAEQAQVLAQKISFRRGLADAYSNLGIVADAKGDFKKGLEYYKRELSLAQELNSKFLTARTLRSLGVTYDDQGLDSLALEYDMQSLAINLQLNDKDGLATNYTDIGDVYYNVGNFPKSLEYDFKSLAIHIELGDKSGIADNYGNIGLCYDDEGDFKKGLEYDMKSLVMDSEIGNKVGLALNLANIGGIYDTHGDSALALRYATHSLTLYKEIGDKDGMAMNLINIGDVCNTGKKYDEALKNYNQALAMSKASNDNRFIAFSYLGIGAAYTELKQFKLAKVYLDSALALSNTNKEKAITQSTYLNLSELDSVMGNPMAQLQDYKKYVAYGDSLINESNTKKTVQAEMNYEFDQRQAAQKAEEEKKDAVAELQRKREAVVRNSLLAGFALVLALAFFIYRGYRQKQKAYVIITRQKEEVDASRKKIMDSIKYAQKIQYSILPEGDEIRKHVTDYAVCFMPKDIVSGDFYWFHYVDGVSYIAVVDCTGHGVPGACMSMLAHSFLNEVVIERHVKDPAEILSYMHQLVFRTLHQQKGDEYSQDGMDISLIAIDHKKGMATFSGAKNSGYLVDGEHIKVLKATSKSIGGLSMTGEVEPTRQFKSETTELKKGMLLVLSTDGMFDQLNASDEKFGKARFNTLAQTMYNTDMEKGQVLAEKTINEWKGKAFQQDDILLMAIRI